MNKIILLVLILYLKSVLSNSCEKHRSCRECIRDTSLCVWCASKSYQSEQRCKPKSFDSGNSTWCLDSKENLQSTIEKDKDKDEPFSSDPDHVTQIKPQGYKISLRPGQPQTFTFSFMMAQNYPIDMYFLFDSSKTMNSVRNHTSNQSQNIYNTMKAMTTNVYMGMGTFVDKNMLPYTKTVASNLSYSFRHHLNLTQDYVQFRKAVELIPQGKNRDSPEAGLDALAQAITCQEKFGWRKHSRKILILMTDESYHAAGDGKSAGVFKPYDGKCYTEDNIYTKELEMDYPSVSMINKLAKDNNVIVIFAVSYSMNNVYSKLADYVTGSKLVTLDGSPTDDIAKKLKEIYEDITTKIKLNVNMRTDPNGSARRKNFHITFDPDCTKDVSTCNVATNELKNITGTIKLLKYDGNDEASIDIGIEGIAEKLTLDINVINHCNCEKEVEVKSKHCNDQKRECGICQCNEPLYGDKCQCERKKTVDDPNTLTCLTGNMTKRCSGRGLCNCGTCTCQPEYAGPYCECFLKNCPMDRNNAICGRHGECQCDETCKCETGYYGNACQCNEKLCLAPNNKVCNNRGKCNCDKCECENLAAWDKRDLGLVQNKYCVIEPCPECNGIQCANLTDCAVCLMNEKNTVNDCKCSLYQDNLNYTLHDKLPDNSNDTGDNAKWHICTKVRVEMGCYTNFTYKYNEDSYGITVLLQKEKNCAEIHYVFGAVFLLCLLLVGVFTLLGWKLITYLRDRNEYLQFIKDHVPDIAPCDNPLYEPASTEFKNPVFEKRAKY